MYKTYKTDLGQEFASKEIVLGTHSMGNMQQFLDTCTIYVYHMYISTYIYLNHYIKNILIYTVYIYSMYIIFLSPESDETSVILPRRHQVSTDDNSNNLLRSPSDGFILTAWAIKMTWLFTGWNPQLYRDYDKPKDPYETTTMTECTTGFFAHLRMYIFWMVGCR